MFALGILLLVIGFALITPRGAAAGGVAHRIVRMNNLSGPFTTPGYQPGGEPSTWRRTLIRILVGLALMGLGLLVMAHWFPETA